MIQLQYILMLPFATVGCCLMKINPKYATLIFTFLVTLLMSGIMSAFLTALHLGITEGFIVKLVHAWASAFPLAFFAGLLVVPLVRKIMTYIIKTPVS